MPVRGARTVKPLLRNAKQGRRMMSSEVFGVRFLVFSISLFFRQYRGQPHWGPNVELGARGGSVGGVCADVIDLLVCDWWAEGVPVSPQWAWLGMQGGLWRLGS